MDLIKTGKFIALKRKEKNLTQDQLAEQLGISGKSVSKWERGLNLPDMDKLDKICEILNTNIIDLLSGDEISLNSDNLNGMSFIDVIKYYIKKSKKIYIFIIFLVLLIFISLISSLFMLNNFNKNQIYTIRSLNSQYEINGYLVFNQDRNIFILNDLKFQGDVVGTLDEPIIKLINVFITYEDKKMMSYTENVEDNKSNQLSSVLDSLSFSMEDNKQNNSNIINYKSDLSKIKLKLEYLTFDNKTECIEVDMDFEEIFSNNKILY